MCKLMEDFAKEYAKAAGEQALIKGKIKTIKNMIKDNIPLETALKYAQIDKATYE